MPIRITFLGASGTVTGSKYLIETSGKRLLVDAGMFQGERRWRDENWSAPKFDSKSIDAVLLTHAHIDHSGMLPRFVKLGLNCPVYLTAASHELTRLVLLDSAHLQEEDAEYHARKGTSRHQPPLPLYTIEDAKKALSLTREVRCGQAIEVLPGIKATWNRMGHILGACSIVLEAEGKRIVFSGDIGRYTVPILKDPESVPLGDLLLVEATYGDRLHGDRQPADELARIVNDSVKRGGTLLVPAFAIGRTQNLLYYLRELKAAGRIPDVPVVVDSPMAGDSSAIYARHPDDYDEEALGIVKLGRNPFAMSKLGFTANAEDSKRLNNIAGPLIIISASGMLTGGRILHHLRQRISSPLNTLLFVGFQPPGSRGAWLKGGAETVRLFGEELPVRAKIEEMSGMSAHGDRDELLRWCKASAGMSGGDAKRRVMIVHAEPEAAQAFKGTLVTALGWDVRAANYLESVEI